MTVIKMNVSMMMLTMAMMMTDLRRPGLGVVIHNPVEAGVLLASIIVNASDSKGF